MRNKIMLDEGMKDVTFTEEESNNCSPGQEQYARCKNRNSTHKTHLLRRDDGQRGEPRIPYTVASLTGWVDGESKGEWGDGVAGKGAVREGIKQARQAEEGGTKLQRSVALSVQGFLAWREMEEAAAAAATLSAAPARMLWPARKGHHDLTAMCNIPKFTESNRLLKPPY